MNNLCRSSRIAFINNLSLFALMLIIGLFGLITLAKSSPISAAAGINNIINYQGRLLTASGATVPDGKYNIEFKIYQDGPGNVVADTGGTLMWTEDSVYATNSPDSRINVKNGYFSVSLGSICPLSGGTCAANTGNAQTNSGVDFNQDTIWLSVNIGNTTTAASFAAAAGDGEMLPMKRLAATPYALNAAKVGGLAAAVLARTDVGNTMIGTQIFQNAATNSVLTVDTTANQITLGKPSTLSGKIVFAASGTANTISLSVGSTTASYNLVLPTTAPALSQCLQNDGATIGQLTFGACGGATGVNQQLSNLSGTVAINLNLLPGVTNTIDAGSASFAFQSGYFATSLKSPLYDTIAGTTLSIGSLATSISINKDSTLAAGKSLTLVGGATGTRPATTAEGMLYYDTTVKGLLIFSNGKWQADRSGNTKIVSTSAVGGVSGAVASSTPDSADFVNASATSAQTVINNAIAALPATGGSIYLMDGVYIIDGPINLPNNITITGSGSSTIIKIKNAYNLALKVFTNTDVATGTRVSIQNLTIDGNKGNNSSGVMHGIYLNNMGSGSGSTAREGARISNVTIHDLRTFAISFIATSNTSVTNSTLTNSTFDGMTVDTSSANDIISNNIFQASSNGLSLSGTNHTVTGNYFGNTTNAGIYLTNATKNTISNNITIGAPAGIQLDAGATNNAVSGNNVSGATFYGIQTSTSAFRNSITGNSVSGNATAGIALQTGNNLVSGNSIFDNGGATSNEGISASSGSNTITGNDITDSSCSTTCYAIDIQSGPSNYISNNRHNSGVNLSTIADLGSGTIFANQPDGNGNQLNTSQAGFTIGTANASSTLTIQGGIKSTALPTPGGPSVLTNGTTGAVTYRYQVTAFDGTGETLPSALVQVTNGNATLSTSNYNTFGWNAVSGAYQYKIYRCTGAACTPTLLATVPTISLFYLDQANGAPSGPLPTLNTTGGAILQGASGLTLGLASTANGTLVMANSSNTNTVTMLSGVTSTSYSLTLPVAAPALSQCLQNDGTTIGTLIFSSCGSNYIIGTLDGGVANAAGASISLGNIYMQSASASNPGLVNTSAQSFSGDKTLNATFNLAQVAKPASAPTAAAGGAGLLTGSFWYVYTYQTAGGETEYSSAGFVSAGASKSINVTVANSANSSVTAKKIYRATTNLGPFALVLTIPDNITTVGNDNNTTPGAFAKVDNTTGALKVGGSAAILVGGSGNNTWLGLQAGVTNNTGNSNTGIGTSAMNANTSGSNNLAAGYKSLFANTTGSNNVSLGTNSMVNSLTGSDNVGIGNTALSVVAGNGNIAVGTQSQQATSSGTGNISLGLQSMIVNNTGSHNIGLGTQILNSNTSGSYNLALVTGALQGNVSGSNNIGLGQNALSTSTVGNGNVASGYFSLANLKTSTGTISATVNSAGNPLFTSTSTIGLVPGAVITLSGTTSYNGTQTVLAVPNGTSFSISTPWVTNDAAGSWTTASTDYNVAYGYQSGLGFGSGQYSGVGNSLFGYQTGFVFKTGANYNSLFGYSAGKGITTGSQNVLIGYNTGINLTSGSNNIIIGQGASATSATSSNMLVIGNLIQGDMTLGTISLLGPTTISGQLTNNGIITLQETTSTGGVAGYGKLFVSTDHFLHFINNTGTDIAIGQNVGAVRKIVLSAEFAGSTLDATNDATCLASNSGTMTSGLNVNASAYNNFYKWTTTQTSAQCYDIVVRIPIPADFSSWSGTPTLSAYTSNATNATIAVETRTTAGAVDGNNYTAITPVAGAWATQSLTGLTSASYTAGGIMTVRIRLSATNVASANDYAEVGILTLPYVSAY